MPLDAREKELAAIGAIIGANCEPCIEHHLAAGREAGLRPAELADAVASALGVRHEAVQHLLDRIDELLGRGGAPGWPAAGRTSKERELVALGVCVGANSHPLLRVHVAAAFAVGLQLHQVKSALKMAGYVQQHAATLTAEVVARAFAERGDSSSDAMAAN